ncbi:unnamed protein product [Laminaria digitata]
MRGFGLCETLKPRPGSDLLTQGGSWGRYIFCNGFPLHAQKRFSCFFCDCFSCVFPFFPNRLEGLSLPAVVRTRSITGEHTVVIRTKSGDKHIGNYVFLCPSLVLLTIIINRVPRHSSSGSYVGV